MFALYLLSFLFLRLPNFYVLPFFPSAFLTTQAFARIGIVLLAGYFMFHFFFRKRIAFTRSQNTVVCIVIFIFLLQTLSFSSAQNIPAFLGRYKDVLVGFLFFFVSFLFRKKSDSIVTMLLATTTFNIVYQSALFFFPHVFSPLFGTIVYQRHWELVDMNLQRGRILTDTYDEVMVPLLFFLLGQKTSLKAYLFRVFLLVNTFLFAFISNFRTRVLMIIAGVACLIIQLKKFSFVNAALFVVTFALLGYAASALSSSTIGFSFVDRLDTSSKTNTKTLSWRIEQISEAVMMAEGNILGVGLGNYYDNLSPSFKRYYSLNSLVVLETRNANEQVHNIFALILAESGFVSLAAFLILLVVFVYQDSIMVRQKNSVKKTFVFGFWILFVYGLFNPIVPVAYQILFWGLRGLVL